MDSPPSLRIFPYHLCETSQVKKAPGRRLTKVKIASVRLEFGLRDAAEVALLLPPWKATAALVSRRSSARRRTPHR